MAPARAERTGLRRALAAWRNLGREQRTVVVAAAVLLATMLLPWYSRTVNAVVGGQLRQQEESKRAIEVFSLVEAAIFLVALAVVVLVLARGDRRAFHLPGGDGTIVALAGAWATVLIFYRFVDKPDGGGTGQQVVEYGLSWGIFFGLLAALGLLVAGLRLRAAELPEPAPEMASNRGAVSSPPPSPPAAAGSVRADATDSVADAAATRALRRREREERRQASADTPVRRERPTPRATPEARSAPRATPEETSSLHATSHDAPTTHPAADAAPTLFDPPYDEPLESGASPRRRPRER